VENLALRLENVEKYFPAAHSGWRALVQPVTRLTVPALRGISFAMRKGETLAVVGANGAGKSTLLRILTTLLIPTHGHAEVCGFDVARAAGKVRLQIGYHTGGDACFYSRLTARENLMLFAALNNLSARDATQRIAQLTEPFHLGEILERQVRALSTGNIHRLGLARAMMHRPSVLILDEPTRSLDPLAAADFRRFLLREIVGAHGTTLIFASHTLAEVEQLAGTIAVLDGGKLVANDTLAGIKSATGAATLEESLEILTRRASREIP
jgi:ABC-type multidrug transport system ATPase subunit